mmetsp:Transcript_11997/g.23899  ORF Transcript_11997/g.23899 Transcript_11997/m.23899 type:complete len:1152 (+) Transcript_11997:114-3569(+)
MPASVWSSTSIFAAVFALVSTPCAHTVTVPEFELVKSILDTAATSDDQNSDEQNRIPGDSSLMGAVAVSTASTTSPQASSFEATIVAQWTTNKQAPSENSAPYLVCGATPDANGYDRAVQISNACAIASPADATVYNAGERTCFHIQMTMNKARCVAALEELKVHVTPYTPWMKVPREAVTGSPPLSRRRFMGILCGSPTVGEIESYKSVAKQALEDTWADDAACRVLDSSFADSYELVQDRMSLLLRPIGAVAVPDGCVLALVASLASGLSMCSVIHDADIELLNRTGRWIIQGSLEKNDSRSLPLHEVGIKGQGQVAQISDTGASLNSCYFYDSSGEVAKDLSGTFDLTRRKVVQYYAKNLRFKQYLPDNYKEIDDPDGHGTHCAGTLVGRVCDYTESECVADSNYIDDGNAPEAKIAVYNIHVGYGLYWEKLHLDSPWDMCTMGINAGAYIHSASWGSSGNHYKVYDQLMDQFTHWQQDYLNVMAAGNDGYYMSSINNGSVMNVGKNTLTVCSTKKTPPYNVDYYSGVGPSNDGRIKPDICAPGGLIFSADTSFQQNTRADTTRQCGTSQKSGTSMACPGVAGGALLIRQYFMDGWYPTGTKVSGNSFTPSGYLIRAVILNSGRALLWRDMGSQKVNSEPYDEHQGFGLISLVDGVYLEGKSKGRIQVFDRLVFTTSDIVAWEETFQIGNCTAQHFSVTLDYFDISNPSLACTSCVLNHLHLTVVKNSETTAFPNGKNTHDNINNSQRVRISHALGDTITVRVNPSNLVQDQTFAVVVSGCLIIDQSAAPSHSPTVASSTPPTSFSDKNYTITRPKMTFQDDDGIFSLLVEYETRLSTKNLNISLFEGDCVTSYNSNEAIKLGMQTGLLLGVYSAFVLVDTHKFNDSPLVTKSTEFGSSVGNLNFCIKAEAIEANISVSYRKDKVKLGYNLSNNIFTVTNNVVEENDILTSDTEVLAKYSVLACRCSPASDCDYNPLVIQQNTLLHICVYPNDTTTVSISNFDMTFEQEGSIVYTAVSFGDSGPDISKSLSVITGDGSRFKVVSRLITALFDSDTFDVRGRAYLEFKAVGKNTRHLIDVRAPGLRSRRDLSGESFAGEAPFNMNVKVGSVIGAAPLSTDGKIISKFAGVIGGLIVLTMMLVFIKMSRK